MAPWEKFQKQQPAEGPWKRFQTEPASEPDEVSTVEDVAKSGASGVARGTLDLVGLPGTISDLMRGGGEWALRKGYEAVTGEAPSPDGGLVERFFAGPRPEVEAQMVGGGSNPLSGENLRKMGSAATGGATEYKPQTTAGEFAGTIGEFIPGAAVGGGSVANIMRFGVVPGAASEAAGQLTEGTAIEPYARVAAALTSPFAVSAAKRLVTPLPGMEAGRQAAVDTLRREGVDLTAGQTTGRKGLQYRESELGGAAGEAFMARQGEQFTGAALKRAGIDAPRATPEVIDNAFTRIGGQFDDLATKTRVPMDAQLQDDMLNSVVEYQSLSANVAPAVERMMNRAAELASKNGGTLEGAAYKNLRSEMGKLSAKADGPTKEALRELQGAIDDAVERHMPQQFMEAWQTARRQYRNMLVLEKAATGAGENAAMGIISPSQLRNATVQQGRRSYARGKGDFADLARSGEAVMKPLPQSGTAPRMAARGGGSAVAAALGAMLGGPGGAAAGAVAGTALPGLIGRALLSAPGRAYLSNQLLGPSAAGGREAILRALLQGPSSVQGPRGIEPGR